ncbi:MAG: RNA 2',3'-cyclic phosphodiesterase [Bacteroidales bacterium]
MYKRLFIAIKYVPDEQFISSYRSIQMQVNTYATIKWVPSHQLHLTLCFLGNTHELLVKPIERAIKEVCLYQQRFEAQIEQLNIFMHRQQPRVLWMGLHPVDNFLQLHLQLTRSLIRELTRHKDTCEVPLVEVNHHFVPHLTLGRFKVAHRLNALQACLNSHAQQSFGSWWVKEVILYESILSPSGPTYRPLVMENLRVVS